MRLFYSWSWAVWLGVAGGLAESGLQATCDERPGIPDSTVAQQTSRSDLAGFDANFAKALAALKARKWEEARALFEDSAAATDPKAHPMSWLAAEFNACHALCLQCRKAEADTLAKQIAVRCESTLGTEDPLTSEALAYLAYVLRQHGHLADAEPVYRRNVQVLEAKYGTEHYLVARAVSKHASLLQSLGKLNEAESLQRRAYAIAQKSGHEDSPDNCFFLTNLASCLQAAQKTEEAAQLMEKAFALVQSTPDSELTSAGHVLREQAEYYRDQHQLDRAEELGHRALLRLVKRPDINRSRFFHYDIVASVYRSILQAKGRSGAEIDARLHAMEQASTGGKATTASAAH